jgi:hypothetical protein
VKSTKATKDEKTGEKKQFHDYNDSKFAKNPSAIADTKEEIVEIMNTRHDLLSYIKSMERSVPDIVSILKDEMKWDLVKDEFKKKNDLDFEEEDKATEPEKDTAPWEEETTAEKQVEETKEPGSVKQVDDGEIDIMTLLKEAEIELN